MVTETYANKIGRITTAGVMTEFPLATAKAGPWSIATGSDGALWFTENQQSQIGRITTAGVVTKFPLGSGVRPTGITAGPDGALWFVEQNGSAVGRITTAGAVTNFAVPTVGSSPWAITMGPDRALWFTELAGPDIGRLPREITNTHDFNADGKSDILWRDNGGDVSVWAMSGGTILGGVSLGNVPTNWSIVGQRDFNGDADLLLAATPPGR